jgi:small-conductance mechanosensitive channel
MFLRPGAGPESVRQRRGAAVIEAHFGGIRDRMVAMDERDGSDRRRRRGRARLSAGGRGLVAGVLLAASAWDRPAVSAQPPPVRDTTADTAAAVPAGVSATAGAPVILGRDTLFFIQAPLGPFTVQQRAVGTRERLLEVARNPFARLGEIRVLDVEGRSDVVMGETVLTTVTEPDARAAGLTRAELAQARAEAIAHALERTAFTTNVRAFATGVLYTLLATLAAVALFRLLNHAFPRLQRRVRAWRRTRIRSLRVQNLEVISGDRIARVLSGVVSLVRLILTLLLVYLYLLLVFSFFPWTRGVATRLVQYAVEPVVAVLQAFVGYVPSMFSIVVIVITTYYVLKLVRLVFEGIASGAITFRGFYPDWADTTYKIVRLLGIALALILIWPHLPASESPHFRGVAAFLGLLLSLGSASAVANVIGGVVMVYMRPFQIGDRVKIADTVGDVVEKTLLVTRVRTTKNVEVTIPNSMVLGNHIINYSSTARTGGILLHTTVTLGYDLSWRKVHEVLIGAARATPGILQEPAPFVLQTALNDHHVSYELNAYTDRPNEMAGTYSHLHQNMQDHCAAAGLEILSPLYAATRDGSGPVLPSH